MSVTVPQWTLKLCGTALPDRTLIGGKAWSIARMLALGLPVPPAFTVTTEACNAYQAGGWPAGLDDELDHHLTWLEQQTGRQFGDGPRPLLLSVRSGAAISMPGMMDTVLNLGITSRTQAALAQESGSAEFARDTHCRFIELYATIVMRANLVGGTHGDPVVLRAAVEQQAGAMLPIDPRDQLKAAICAVFDSWNGRRARKYRQHNGIDDNLGTAVTIQAMVFGNFDDASGTGVLFSRNPLTGEAVPFGEYLSRAQGEDVVSGKYTPLPLDEMARLTPAAHAQLLAACDVLERDSRDMQDIEFTVQQGRLFLLQARAAKRAPLAAVIAAVAMAEAGLIDRREAVTRVSAEQAREILRPALADGVTADLVPLARGTGACPGIASGTAVNDPDEADRRAAAGEDVVLVRQTTSPDDIHGMIAARAIITAQGGATSHAAVVSRALGRPCIVGCGDAILDLAGQQVTVDGSGLVWPGRLPMTVPAIDACPALARLLGWASELGDDKFTEQASPAVAATGPHHG